MKKITLLSLLLLFCFNFLTNAQDIIYKKDGSKEEVKITLVSDKEIQYKKFSNLEGPVYSVSKSDILLITYENGEYEMLENQMSPAKIDKKELSTNFTKNLLTYHLFDVIYGDITFSYERILSYEKVMSP